MIDTTHNDKHSEAEAIGKNFTKIAKLTYGKNGLLTFLDDLFLDLTEIEKQRNFNFYFALKKQILSLERKNTQFDSVEQP
jgi:hypothetical protein